MNFTQEQKDIFDFVKNNSGNGIIDAVAGAGKTTTIMECVRYIDDRSATLFCAFNNSIANEIRRKFQERGMHEVTVKTMHALGRQILVSNNSSGRDLQLNENKYDELIRTKEIQEALSEQFEKLLSLYNLSTKSLDDRKNFAGRNLGYRIQKRLLDANMKFRATLTKMEIEAFKKMVIHFGLFNSVEIAKKDFDKEIEAYFECHKILLEAGNELSRNTMIIDFTDMLYLPYEWKLNPANLYSFLFIDECQDLSKSQLAVALKFGRQDGRVIAVGDPFQSIYGFTGADIESFDRVKKLTKGTQLPLTTSFRCPQSVIQLAQKIRPDITGTKEEAGKVSNINFSEVANHAKPGDLIISRLRTPLLLMVFEFIDRNLKVQIHEDEVREIIEELKSIFKSEELNSIIDPFGNSFESIRQTVEKRWSWIINNNAGRIIDATERKLYIEEEQNYLKEKLSFIEKKYHHWKDECSNIMSILKKIKDYITETENPIKLSTIHRAKGLENRKVFIINYDDLPYTRLEQKDWEKLQELNLKYVAITRAMEELCLVQSKKIASIEKEGSMFDNVSFDDF